MTTRRSDQLRTVAEEFTRIHNEWASDPNRKVPDGAYWSAVDDLTEAFANGDVPEDCRELSDAVQAFAEQAQEFDERDDPVDNLTPPADFWAAREKIGDVLAGKTAAAMLPPLESIPTLKQLAYITDMQIAKIYGFQDRRGNWLPHLVQRELDTPGSVLKTPGAIDGRDWQDPRLPPRDGNSSAERTATKISDKRKAAAKKAPEPCRESPKEIWELKPPVTTAQAAKMLQIPEAEVAELFAKFDEERDAALKSGDLVSAEAQHIRELTSQGFKPPAIAQRLGIPQKVVKEALAGWTAPVTSGAE